MTARLEAAAAAVDAAAELTAGAAAHLARDAAEDGRISVAKLDRQQVLAYDLAHLASALEGCRVMLDYGGHGELEGMLAGAFVADVVADVAGRIVARDEVWGVSPDVLRPALDFVDDRRSPEFLESIAARLPKQGTGPAHLSDDFELVRETFHRFAEEKVRPVAEHVHRANADIPEDVIAGLAEIGGFGLSVPEEYGGFAAGGEHDYLGMVVATEELSWGSLGVGGSLITRPEILTRAIVQGGTEEQKQRWLAGIASGELMVGVMVTEPDYGSDVAQIRSRRGRPNGAISSTASRRGRRSRAGPTSSCSSPAPTPTGRPATAGSRCSSSRRSPPPGTSSRSSSRVAARSRAAPSTRSATGACTPTRSPSTTGSCPPRTSSAAKPGSDAASTSRWKRSRTAVCRRQPAPWASCKPRSRRGPRSRREGAASARWGLAS